MSNPTDIKTPQLQPLELRTSMMWYIHGEWNGRWYTRGGYTSEGEARAKAQAMFPQGSHWEVVELPTRDLQRAKEILKNKGDLNSGG